ncbi:hypothetical protein DFH09DRAFT_1098925 [Mycena vulgaris]|nr:hypothetical protein DFH09DRAFT_1098925 [Mycena vulgaris]
MRRIRRGKIVQDGVDEAPVAQNVWGYRRISYNPERTTEWTREGKLVWGDVGYSTAHAQYRVARWSFYRESGSWLLKKGRKILSVRSKSCWHSMKAVVFTINRPAKAIGPMDDSWWSSRVKPTKKRMYPTTSMKILRCRESLSTKARWAHGMSKTGGASTTSTRKEDVDGTRASLSGDTCSGCRAVPNYKNNDEAKPMKAQNYIERASAGDKKWCTFGVQN